MAFPVEVVATLALILSIWNTIILLRRRLVRAEDFITLLELIAEATPNPYDDRIVERMDFITLLELIAEATPNPYDDRIVGLHNPA